MIGFLKGRPVFEESEPNKLFMDVSGVGYELLVSQGTLDSVSGLSESFLHVYTHVREDQLVLFGFSSKVEKKLFLSLIKVNGIGPKVAIGALSAMKAESIIKLIDTGDVKGLTRLPKVGKKTAEQMILNLKGKLVLLEESSEIPSTKKDITSALVNLGFKIQDVQWVVDEFSDEVTLEDGVRLALAKLSR